jgi:uncharacterized lipoprotein YmbA
MNPNNEIQEQSLKERGHSWPQQAPNARSFPAVYKPNKTPRIAADRNVRAPVAAPRYGIWASLFLAVCAGLTGCSFLKPTPSTERHFVLTPLPATAAASTPGSVGLGVAQVKVPAYLFNYAFAVREGTNEIRYLQSVRWAEYLDTAVQRVLAANLASLLHTDHVRLSTWRSNEVTVEIYVVIEQLDINKSGEGVLTAWWRILSPGGERTLKSGDSRLVRQGPPPEKEPSGAIATLSGLVGEFSEQLAQAITETAPSGATPSTGLRSSP